jgi:hypothetical protein
MPAVLIVALDQPHLPPVQALGPLPVVESAKVVVAASVVGTSSADALTQRQP